MSEGKPTAAFILSLIAGILIALSGGVGSVFMGMMGLYSSGWRGMMGDYGMMGWPVWGFGMALGITGLAMGIIVIIGAIMLDLRPQEHKTWGTVILVFSILSIIGGIGGFGLGLILGIIGGALAISWTPRAPAARPPQPARYCVHCGRTIASDAKFCPQCGKEQPA